MFFVTLFQGIRVSIVYSFVLCVIGALLLDNVERGHWSTGEPGGLRQDQDLPGVSRHHGRAVRPDPASYTTGPNVSNCFRMSPSVPGVSPSVSSVSPSVSKCPDYLGSVIEFS